MKLLPLLHVAILWYVPSPPGLTGPTGSQHLNHKGWKMTAASPHHFQACETFRRVHHTANHSICKAAHVTAGEGWIAPCQPGWPEVPSSAVKCRFWPVQSRSLPSRLSLPHWIRGGGVSKVLPGAFHGTTPYSLSCGMGRSSGLRLTESAYAVGWREGLAVLVGWRERPLSLLAVKPEQVTTNKEKIIDLQVKARDK